MDAINRWLLKMIIQINIIEIIIAIKSTKEYTIAIYNYIVILLYYVLYFLFLDL